MFIDYCCGIANTESPSDIIDMFKSEMNNIVGEGAYEHFISFSDFKDSPLALEGKVKEFIDSGKLFMLTHISDWVVAGMDIPKMTDFDDRFYILSQSAREGRVLQRKKGGNMLNKVIA